MFNELDSDLSGSIDAQELESALRRLGQHPSEQQVLDLIASVDEGDPDGKIQMREFLKLYQLGLDTNDGPVKEMCTNIFLSMGKDPRDNTATISTDEVNSRILDEYGLDVNLRDVFGLSSTEVDRKAFEELVLTPR